MTRHRRHWLVGGGLAALLLVAGSFALAKAQRSVQTPTPIAIQATAIDSFDTRDPSITRFGALEFRGGLVLTSNNAGFGGVSGLHIESDGRSFLSVIDNGSWLRGRIVYRNGKPEGISNAELAPMLGPDGKPLTTRGWGDAESLTERDGMFYAGIERAEQILRFDYRRHGLLARGEPIAVPPDFKSFAHNKSMECLAAPPNGAPLAGSLIVITERSLDSAGNHRAFLFGRDHQVERFSVKRSDDFDVTDCVALPPGGLLLLERRYSPARGAAMRIRRFELAGLKPGATVDGKVLIEADLAYQIDNMEGIAVHRNAAGETIITVVSDDNFSPLQRNLLLQFAIVGE